MIISDRLLVITAEAAEPVPFVDDIVRNLLTRLQTDSTHTKLKVLNVVIALLDGGVSDEDDEAEAPGLRCMSMPTIFSVRLWLAFCSLCAQFCRLSID